MTVRSLGRKTLIVRAFWTRPQAESVVDGKWLTIGDPVNYLSAVVEYALADDEISAAFEPRLRALLNG